MPTNYVEDYEQVTGETIPNDAAPVVETKVVSAPETVAPVSETVAEVE